jgi:hypothetical protein
MAWCAGAVSVDRTITVPPATEPGAAFVAGFVTAEGSFISTKPNRFGFAVGLGGVDGAMCEQLREFFGCGSVHRAPRRKPHYDDEVTFAVRALPDLVELVIPFMDEHLAPSYKRDQYLRWRADLLDYWEHRARRPARRVSRRPRALPTEWGRARVPR